MRPHDIERIVKLYSDRLDLHGVSPKTLGWDKDRINLRFEILCSRWNLNGRSILDFGCGFGNLCGFLVGKNTKLARYLGIDINPRLLDVARRLHPIGEFRVMNLIEEPLEENVDYIFASGVFNDKIEDNRAFIARAFEVFNRLARMGFAANFLSSKAQIRYPHAHYTDPWEALELCYGYSNNVVLRNDYMPFEFTVFVNKSSQIHPELAVYQEFLELV